MAKFERKGKNELQAISTASLPDIVFMLLFFFEHIFDIVFYHDVLLIRQGFSQRGRFH